MPIPCPEAVDRNTPLDPGSEARGSRASVQGTEAEVRDTVGRRRFLTVLAAAPAALAGLAAISAAGAAVRAARPSSRGSSVSVCASCGRRGHAMLACDATPKVV
jgi:hypothetical protein